MTRYPPARVILATAIVCALAASARAQSLSSIEVGADVSGFGIYSTPVKTGVYGGGPRVDVPLTRRVDIDFRSTWFPTRAVWGHTQGGRTLQGAVGVRGRFFDGRRVTFYGGLWPGFVHFSNIIVGADKGGQITGGATHFALDMGFGSEFRIGERWVLHAETTGPLYAVNAIELARSAPNSNGAQLVVGIPSEVANVWQVSAGAGYRLGTRRADDSEQPVASRWEAGGQLSRATTAEPYGLSSLLNLSGVGGFASYRVAPGVYADAAVSFFPRLVTLRTAFTGGRLSQAVGGAKLGTRNDRYGFFGKLRVGVNSHSGAVREETERSPTFARYTATAIDAGGVFERYIGRRWVVRFDGGDVISVFHPTTVTLGGNTAQTVAPAYTDSIQLVIGAGWRF